VRPFFRPTVFELENWDVLPWAGATALLVLTSTMMAGGPPPFEEMEASFASPADEYPVSSIP